MAIHDFLIIGAGPAGSTAGALLVKHGYSVSMIDRHVEMPRKVCGEYLCPKGVDVIRELGWSEKLLKNFRSVTGMDITAPSGNVVHAMFPCVPNVSPTGVSVSRDQFDGRLLQNAIESGVKTFLGEHVLTLSWIRGIWELTTKSGKVFHARNLIGADGRQSIVAKTLGLEKSPSQKRVAFHWFANSCLKSSSGSVKNGNQGEMHIFSDGSYIGINHTGDTETNMSLVLNSSRVRDFNSHDELINHYINMKPKLVERFGLVGTETKILSAFPIEHRVRAVAGKNFALVGDAAGFIDPLTGEGMFNALWMGRQLAMRVNERKNENLFDCSGAFEAYARDHKSQFLQKKILNSIFQFVISKPWLVELLGKFLNTSQSRRDTFVGIIGNIYSPGVGLFRLLFVGDEKAPSAVSS
jgi:flavin-dependent dehydrogenase